MSLFRTLNIGIEIREIRLVGKVVAMEAVRQPVVCAVVKNRNRWKCCIRPHRFRVLGDDLLIDEGSGLCTAVDADSRKFELLHSEAPRRAATATTIAARWEDRKSTRLNSSH